MRFCFLASCFISAAVLGSCAKILGWGITLWAIEEPAIPSGTVMPVYIKSNINQVWVAGVPEAYRNGEPGFGKIEIPLSKLELVGSKNAAQKRAEDFSPLALLYGETAQDGLPIRVEPDNSARRSYRLRRGEVIKILEEIAGSPPISASGEPLPGVWYKVLTENGSVGYCFSYRLRLFEHPGGPFAPSQAAAAAAAKEEPEADPELDRVLSKDWHPESYGAMTAAGKIDLAALTRRWRFSPGQDAGTAHIYVPEANLTFPYTAIRREGPRLWRFEGSSLHMRLRSDTVLEAQFTEEGGALRMLVFVTLPFSVDDLIVQETARQETLFQHIYGLGPSFNSVHYGTLVFTPDGRFSWAGADFPVPSGSAESNEKSGRVNMGFFLDPPLAAWYDGAFSLSIENTGMEDTGAELHFLYILDNQGLRLEYAPPASLDGLTVSRQAESPVVIYFFKAERPPVF
ncbi:MAG: SH3 domain-containing protein [Spirochaetaceae bacterium]|jgi:hypothetical protein|nr:SH3 domain-containing protein [Spirochaetaceae bacterium]